jgi:hypothetical protein
VAYLIQPTAVQREIFPYFVSQGSGVTETIYLALPAHALQALQVWSKFVCNEGHITLAAETVFVPLSPRISAERGGAETSCVALPAHRNMHGKFGRNRSVIKGTLLMRSKQFFISLALHGSRVTNITCCTLFTSSSNLVEIGQ